MKDHANPNIWKGIAAGALGGLAASYVMNQFQAGVSAAGQRLKPDEGEESQQQQSQSEPATVKAAEAVSTHVAGHELTEREKKIGGPVVHDAFRAANGMLYGALAEYSSSIQVCRGTAFGAGLWALADEVAVPAFGLSRSPLQSPASTHLEALAAHRVYGLTTDLMYRGVRARI